jgi:hypothetical protein
MDTQVEAVLAQYPINCAIGYALECESIRNSACHLEQDQSVVLKFWQKLQKSGRGQLDIELHRPHFKTI